MGRAWKSAGKDPAVGDLCHLRKDSRSSKGKAFPTLGIVLEMFKHRAGGGLRYRVAIAHRSLLFVFKELLQSNHVFKYEGQGRPSAWGLDTAVSAWRNRGSGLPIAMPLYMYEALYVVFDNFSPAAMRERRTSCLCKAGKGCQDPNESITDIANSKCKCRRHGLVCNSKCHHACGTCTNREYEKHKLVAVVAEQTETTGSLVHSLCVCACMMCARTCDVHAHS